LFHCPPVGEGGEDFGAGDIGGAFDDHLPKSDTATKDIFEENHNTGANIYLKFAHLDEGHILKIPI